MLPEVNHDSSARSTVQFPSALSCSFHSRLRRSEPSRTDSACNLIALKAARSSTWSKRLLHVQLHHNNLSAILETDPPLSATKNKPASACVFGTNTGLDTLVPQLRILRITQTSDRPELGQAPGTYHFSATLPSRSTSTAMLSQHPL